MPCISLMLRADCAAFLQAVSKAPYWCPYDSAPHFYHEILSFNNYPAVGFILEGGLNKIRYSGIGYWKFGLERNCL